MLVECGKPSILDDSKIYYAIDKKNQNKMRRTDIQGIL